MQLIYLPSLHILAINSANILAMRTMPKKPAPKTVAKIRKEPGKSNAYKYSGVSDFAGPNGTFPINTLARAKSALKLAHNASNPSAIKTKVYRKYPSLKK